jgi:hypothetical protein
LHAGLHRGGDDLCPLPYGDRLDLRRWRGIDEPAILTTIEGRSLDDSRWHDTRQFLYRQP